MITRGSLIGKIVDDFSSLKYQIETRNKLGYTDLSLFCENFFKEVLNVTYDLNLINLNEVRSNNPGLDLGDRREEVAFQITSTRTSEKINKTLEVISKEKELEFKKIKVFIIGKKQNTYSLDLRNIDFNEKEDIIDLDDLLKSIVILDVDKLSILFDLFKLEFRTVKVELEIVDSEGNFESSYSKIAETIPNSPPKNALKLVGVKDDDYEEYFDEIIDLYRRLSRVPRTSRELLYYIQERGKSDGYGGQFNIIPEILEKVFQVTSKEMLVDINILENESIVCINPDDIDGRDVYKLTISDSNLNTIFHYLIEKEQSIRTLVNTMDFTILDEEE